MPPSLRPLAIGLAFATQPADDTQRSATRVSLALRATREGYSLIETFEIDGCRPPAEATFQAAEELAVRLDAQALIVSGLPDDERVHTLARRARLMIVEVPSVAW